MKSKGRTSGPEALRGLKHSGEMTGRTDLQVGDGEQGTREGPEDCGPVTGNERPKPVVLCAASPVRAHFKHRCPCPTLERLVQFVSVGPERLREVENHCSPGGEGTAMTRWRGGQDRWM